MVILLSAFRKTANFAQKTKKEKRKFYSKENWLEKSRDTIIPICPSLCHCICASADDTVAFDEILLQFIRLVV